MGLTASLLKCVFSCQWPAKADTLTRSSPSSFILPLGFCQCTAPEWRVLDNSPVFTCCTCSVYVFFWEYSGVLPRSELGVGFSLVSLPAAFTYLGLWCRSDAILVYSTPVLSHSFGAFLKVSAIFLTTWQYFRSSSAIRQHNSDHLPDSATNPTQNASPSTSH